MSLRLATSSGHADAMELRDGVAGERSVVIAAPVPRDGERGVSDLLVEPAGVAGVIALTRIVYLWLHRDRRRSLTIERVEGSVTRETYRFSGENISLEVLEQAIEALAGERRPGAGAGPASPEAADGGSGHDDVAGS